MGIQAGGARRRLLACLLVAVLVSTGCSSDDHRDAATAPVTATELRSDASRLSTSGAKPATTPSPTALTVGKAPDWRYVTSTTPGAHPGDLLTVTTPMFEGGTYTDVWKTPAATRIVDAVTNEFLIVSADVTHGPDEPPTVYQLVGTVMFTSPGVVSVRYELYSYTAGTVRPDLRFQAQVLDLVTAAPITASDFFPDPSAIAVVDELVREALISQLDVTAGDLMAEVSLTDAAVVPTLDGLQFSFDRGTILPAVFGEGAVVELPWSDLTGLIDPLWIAVAGSSHGREILPAEEPTRVWGTTWGIEPDLPFGTHTDDVLNTIGILLGPSMGDTGFVPAAPVCETIGDDDRIRVVTWGDLDLMFSERLGFLGWTVTDRGYGTGDGSEGTHGGDCGGVAGAASS